MVMDAVSPEVLMGVPAVKPRMEADEPFAFQLKVTADA